MTIEQFLTENYPLEIEPQKLVAHLTGFSNSQARRLIEQQGVSVHRNDTDLTITPDDFFLKGDVVRVGKGRFYTI